MKFPWRKVMTVVKFTAAIFLTNLVEKGHVKIKPKEKALIEEALVVIGQVEKVVGEKDGSPEVR